MYKIYKILTLCSAPILSQILKNRCKSGKEISSRILEKKGITNKPRPNGKLIWFHGASVGEAQSTLILINKFLSHNKDINILVTTGTVTSAELMENKLPKQAFHQFYPLDHPKWVEKFINHWKPDAVIWMESELWPNMLQAIKNNNTPAILVNAHISEKSYSSWLRLPKMAKITLSAFNKILCQTSLDMERFNKLGAKETVVTDNLKYSSDPLAHDKNDLTNLKEAIQNRPIWLYASTHKGEEELACKSHIALKEKIPNILTIIIPRHPHRRNDINDSCKAFNLNIKFRGNDKVLPDPNDDIYIADTLGELGLFYTLSNIVCIGRSFSDDGGGGHNPIEAAQLNCGIIYGKNIQNLQNIFDEMNEAKAAICINSPDNLSNEILTLLKDKKKLSTLQNNGKKFTETKNNVVNKVIHEILPYLKECKCL